MDYTIIMQLLTDLFGYGLVMLLPLITLPRRFRDSTTAALGVLLLAVVEIIQFYSARFTILRLAGTPLMLVLFGVLTTEGKLWKRLCYSLLGFLGMAVADFLMILICNDPDVAEIGPMALPLPVQAYMRAVSVVILAGIIWMLYLLLKDRDVGESFKTKLTMLVFPAVLLAVCILVLRCSVDAFTMGDQVSKLFTAFTVLTAGWCVLFLMNIDLRGKRREQEIISATLAQCIGGQQSYYDELTAQYEADRRMRHDIAKHFRAIHAMLDSGDTGGAVAYVKSLETEWEQGKQALCENPVVDAYLQSVIASAKKVGVEIRPTVSVPANLPIGHAELVCIFGNLLDNAVEAAEGAEEPVVELKSLVQGGCFVITVRNSIADGKKKTGSSTHYGVGHKILRGLAQKYDGTVSFQQENGAYTASAVFTV